MCVFKASSTRITKLKFFDDYMATFNCVNFKMK